MKNISNSARLTSAALAATLITSFVPAVAAAQEAPGAANEPRYCKSYEGTYDWGVLARFRKYVTGKIAQGKVTYTTGATGADASDPKFAFKFTPDAPGVIDQDSAIIPLKGEIRFTGHHDVLNMLIEDIRLDIDGKEVKIIANYTTNEVAEFDKNAPKNTVTRANAELGKYTLAAPANFTAGALDLSGTPAVAEGAHKLFLEQYDVGTPMDPVSGALRCTAFVEPKPQAPAPKPEEPKNPKPEEPKNPKPEEPKTSAPTTAPTADPKPPAHVVPTTAPTAEPKPPAHTVPTTAPTADPKPPAHTVPTTAPTADPKPEHPLPPRQPGFKNLRELLNEFKGNPVAAILSLVSIGGLIAILTGIGPNLLNLFKR
ncbi:HtaA domain-containing protein [Corynebacterium freiburgense]|uniref:HtaA domain-containing protein n=1 Tax=Corynebacterium freiburgense TaxID=556548 RepID=UPI000402D03D|nr:HtaA domain-containing protein [Corynebacterium freiburgense]WJZ01797.1 Htaa [Corynebacterium freiburgense]